jgi:predicted phosphate transport protein (TIGR00153 family)
MPEIPTSPFKRTRAIEAHIDEFIGKLSEAGMVFEQAIAHYAEHGADDVLEERLAQIAEMEKRGDELRRDLERALFTEMLIPDARGDVLSLLDDLDDLLDGLKVGLQTLVIERPQFPKTLREDLHALATAVVRSIEETAVASRAYFRDPGAVPDHIHKIAFYEGEADDIALRMAKAIFGSKIALERKRHLRDCVSRIDRLADDAEDVGDRLGIYAVKRSL